MSDVCRAVLDTSVIISSGLSRSDRSPNREILTRAAERHIDLLYSLGTLHEYERKLAETNTPIQKADEILTLIVAFGEEVSLERFHLRSYPKDMLDVEFLLCAINGDATHLISYDRHLLDLDRHYPFRICPPIPFLEELRARR